MILKKLRRAKTVHYDVEIGYRQTLVNSLIDKPYMLWYITHLHGYYVGGITLYQCRRQICNPPQKCKMINQTKIEIRNIN